MTVYRILGIISAVVFSLGYIPYVVSIVRGKTKPHPFSWLLWSVIGAVTFYFYVHVGAIETLPFAFLNFFLPCVVVVLSIKNWQGSFSRFDYACLGLSFVSILVYLSYHNAAFALSLNLCGDILAYLPTIRKTWRAPASEDLTTWGFFVAGYALSIFAAIPRFTYGIAVLPIYDTVLGIVMCGLIYARKKAKIEKYKKSCMMASVRDFEEPKPL